MSKKYEPIMTTKEKNDIIRWISGLNDEQLKNEYYDAVYDGLGSVAEEMYERGYDTVDIIEQERHEKWMDKRCQLIENACYERGIKLWDRGAEQ